ncbi:MAG: peptidoglycan DD-metalloendopeptidase family protein, partial [Candidatus Paceibacterota bacterium]
MNIERTFLNKLLVRLLLVAIFVVIPGFVLAVSNITELQNQIQATNKIKQDIEKEIALYQTQLDSVGKEKSTLQSAIKTIDISRSKLSAEIALTQNKIKSTELIIKNLSINIKNKNEEILSGLSALTKAIRDIQDIDTQSPIMMFLTNKTLSETWNEFDNILRFQDTVRMHVGDVRNVKDDLEQVKLETEAKKKELNNYKSQLTDQKSILDANKNEKANLLALTKNKESEYKKILADREAKQAEFERELANYEAQLKIAVDPNSLPASHTGVIAWPLDLHVITQYFGNTEFATVNAQIYRGQGHNGIDLRAAMGTPVKSSLSGVVEATGNTDAIKGCIAFGKWILVRHYNGLSTLYAHLSLIRVTKGTEVKTGDIIGYSGASGQVTGPHLHFTVYATQGVRFVKYSSKSRCYGATV